METNQQVNMRMPKATKTKLMICAIVFILALGAYLFLYVKNATNNEGDESIPKENNNKEENVVEDEPKETIFDIREDCPSAWYIEDNPELVCEKELLFGEETLNFRIEILPNREFPDEAGLYQRIVLNDKPIFELTRLYGNDKNSADVIKIELFEDVIIITPAAIDGAGFAKPIIIIDHNGKVILDFYGNSVIKGHFSREQSKGDKYFIIGNKIIYETTYELFGRPSCDNVHPLTCVHIHGASDPWITVTKNNYEQHRNLVISRKFEVEYLGNSKFSEIKIIEEVRLSEKYSSEHFQN